MKQKINNLPVVLLILDGWGMAPKTKGNAIELAKTPNFDFLQKKYPITKLQASGNFAGLPEHQPGNSEAGHMNIGAGRLVLQDSVVINRAIADKTFYQKLPLKHLVSHIKANNSRLHVMGLVSDEDSPHSSIYHIMAIVNYAKVNKIKKVFLHFFTDGRDSPQHASRRVIHKILTELRAENNYRNGVELVSIMGRFYAMDRVKNWSRTKKAYECLVGDHPRIFKSYEEAIEHSYNAKLSDEYLEPAVIDRKNINSKESRIKDGDAIIFTNLRSDRARQLTKAFVQKDFNEKNPGAFKRKKVLKNIIFCAMTDFGPDLSNNLLTLFPGVKLIGTLPFELNGFTQLYIAETEKFAHVTYFLNGGYPDPVNRETRVRIPSQKIINYASQPEMSVYKITEKVLGYLKRSTKDVIIINFANPDMVGHTGDLNATIKAVEHCDKCLGKIAKMVLNKKGTMIVTADHGNAEKMIDENDEVYTQHTSNPVPFILVNDKLREVKLRKNCSLSDIAPTIYQILNIKSSESVSAKSIINKKTKK